MATTNIFTGTLKDQMTEQCHTLYHFTAEDNHFKLPLLVMN